jgi:hypothetical protein
MSVLHTYLYITNSNFIISIKKYYFFIKILSIIFFSLIDLTMLDSSVYIQFLFENIQNIPDLEDAFNQQEQALVQEMFHSRGRFAGMDPNDDNTHAYYDTLFCPIETEYDNRRNELEVGPILKDITNTLKK